MIKNYVILYIQLVAPFSNILIITPNKTDSVFIASNKTETGITRHKDKSTTCIASYLWRIIILNWLHKGFYK